MALLPKRIAIIEGVERNEAPAVNKPKNEGPDKNERHKDNRFNRAVDKLGHGYSPIIVGEFETPTQQMRLSL